MYAQSYKGLLGDQLEKCVMKDCIHNKIFLTRSTFENYEIFTMFL